MVRPPVVTTRDHSVLIETLQSAEVSYADLPELLSSGGQALNLEDSGINPQQRVFHNAPIPVLYEEALRNEKGTRIAANGAMVALSGRKTGRSPKDKRVVDEKSTTNDVWWGPVNIKLDEHSFLINRERAIDYLNTREQLYVVDGYAGWDTTYRLKIRVVCSRAYHALFMRNMLVKPTDEELTNFGKPDFTIFNAGCFPANRFVEGMSSSCSVALNFARNEMVISGTQYAGEMKKGVLTVMMYLMPKRGLLCLHSSCNEGPDGVTVFFGLSGTGKTTLSADPARDLIGDDEHVWTEKGIFNVEGGCYAKTIGLSHAAEPEIYEAIRFGSIVENVVMNDTTREIDYDDDGLTQNTRCAYPLEYIPNAKLPAVCGHPSNVVLLTCDAFGVLPPISKLTMAQVEFQFISGYTAKVAGTEEGVTEPKPTFSACFGGPFLVWHPTKYAKMLAEKLEKHTCNAWLLNTGWVGGSAGMEGSHRISLKYSRAIVDAINKGELAKVKTQEMPGFGMGIPESCPGVPSDVLKPWLTWKDQGAYRTAVNKLAAGFRDNFKLYTDEASEAVRAASPKDWPEEQK